ncbi:MAG: hypothetical protein J6A36_02775, partial [Clostridia bacterium]|nr:hypothetical protein [Clostridia bacterium]
NIDSILKSPEETKTMLGNLIDKGLIDTVLSSASEYVTNATEPMGIPQFDDANNYTGYIDYAVKKEDYSIIISIDDSGIYKAEYGDVNISSGGSVSSGTTLVTDKAFTNNEGASPEEQGKFVIDNDASVMFVDRITGELSIQVKSGTHAKIYAFRDMTLTNSGIKRSAIDIEPGGTLDLYVAEGATVTVNSGLGEDASGNTPGKGGYAGIHVPWKDTNNDNTRDDGEYAILNLYGYGTVKAIGGNAGSGGTPKGNGQSTSGGGGAGAGIGGNGANGGQGVNGGRGNNGLTGENCGNVNIYNSIVVYAYGGGGGSGGKGSLAYNSAGGGGGYPSAGIGGGGASGAGSTCCAGAGGYTGGTGDSGEVEMNNGLAGHNGGSGGRQIEGGGGYFLGGEGISQQNSLNRATLVYGGFANQGAHGSQTGIPPEYSHMSGNGGIAGQGGNIVCSEISKIYAFNGNLYSDGTDYQKGINQCPIYAQAGVIVAKYKYVGQSTASLFSIELDKAQSSVSQSGYFNQLYNEILDFKNAKIVNINTKLGITGNTILTNVDMSKQGVGSGAGYIEISNGTYTIDASMN